MKTPEEIKKGLECANNCSESGLRCNECPYLGSDCDLFYDVLAYIQQLESELEAVKRERDAAVRDFKSFAQCKNNICHYCVAAEDMCGDCGWRYPDLFIWRGVCPENTEVQEDE